MPYFLQTLLISLSSRFEYSVPFSVGNDRYTIFGSVRYSEHRRRNIPRTLVDLPRGYLAVGVRKHQYFVPRALDGRRLMAIYMSGIGRNNALDLGECRRDYNYIRLRCAGDKFYQRIVSGDQLFMSSSALAHHSSSP